MPTDRITRPTSPIETIRALARERTARATGSTSAAEQGRPAAPIERRSLEDLRGRLRQIFERVDTHDPQSLISIREPVLREILLWEFGSDFRQDAEFLPMVDAIGKMLDVDPQFHQRFAALVTTLQAR
jgi:hypothetical protein